MSSLCQKIKTFFQDMFLWCVVVAIRKSTCNNNKKDVVKIIPLNTTSILIILGLYTMTFSWRYFCHHFKNLEVLFSYDIISLFTFTFWLGFSASNDVTIPHAIFIRRDFSRVARNQMTYMKTEHGLRQHILASSRCSSSKHIALRNVKTESNFIFTIYFWFTRRARLDGRRLWVHDLGETIKMVMKKIKRKEEL